MKQQRSPISLFPCCLPWLVQRQILPFIRFVVQDFARKLLKRYHVVAVKWEDAVQRGEVVTECLWPVAAVWLRHNTIQQIWMKPTLIQCRNFTFMATWSCSLTQRGTLAYFMIKPFKFLCIVFISNDHHIGFWYSCKRLRDHCYHSLKNTSAAMRIREL